MCTIDGTQYHSSKTVNCSSCLTKEHKTGEINAAKRFITHLNNAHPILKLMICGDGLMSHQPMIEDTVAAGNHYLFIARLGDHKYLVEWINTYESLASTTIIEAKGNSHIYTWQNEVTLNGGEKAINVNWFQYQFKNAQVKITKTHKISKDNVSHMTRAGRCRCKIENECFNTLKN